MNCEVLPVFDTFKCQTLCRIALRRIVVAGINRRPCLPNTANTADTMKFVASYIAGLKGIALNEPIYCKDLQPYIQVPLIQEPSTAERYNRYATFMRCKRKAGAVVGLDDN